MPETQTDVKPRACAWKDCRQDFTPATAWQRYCSPRCGNLARVHRHRSRLVAEAKEGRKASGALAKLTAELAAARAKIAELEAALAKAPGAGQPPSPPAAQG